MVLQVFPSSTKVILQYIHLKFHRYNTRIEVYNSVVYFYQLFQRPLVVEKQLLQCTHNWQNSGTLWHAISMQYSKAGMQDTLQGQKATIPLLYFSYTLPVSTSLVPNVTD